MADCWCWLRWHRAANPRSQAAHGAELSCMLTSTPTRLSFFDGSQTGTCAFRGGRAVLQHTVSEFLPSARYPHPSRSRGNGAQSGLQNGPFLRSWSRTCWVMVRCQVSFSHGGRNRSRSRKLSAGSKQRTNAQRSAAQQQISQTPERTRPGLALMHLMNG
ncbi:hypothetical protein BKA80DRAFT_263927 [Phyllosticta citrichinensis]